MGQPGSLNDVELRAWHAFLTAGALVNRSLDRRLKEAAGLSHPQYEILVRLGAAPENKMRMTELAGAIVNSKSRLTYQVTQLEQAGFVCRNSCPNDDRGVTAALTDAGRELLERTAPFHLAAVRDAFIDLLTPAQVAALAEGLGEISNRLGDRRADRPVAAVAG